MKRTYRTIEAGDDRGEKAVLHGGICPVDRHLGGWMWILLTGVGLMMWVLYDCEVV